MYQVFSKYVLTCCYIILILHAIHIVKLKFLSSSLQGFPIYSSFYNQKKIKHLFVITNNIRAPTPLLFLIPINGTIWLVKIELTLY